MDSSMAFAELATKVKYADLPPQAADAARKNILDTLGTALAGSGGEGVEEMVGLALDFGGKPEASIINQGVKVPSPMAAVVNGFIARTVDYDDTYEAAVLHAGATVLSAELGCAQRRGGVSGKELVTAHALGVDMICRMGLSRQDGRASGWCPTPLYGYFGAALASSRILGLDAEKTLNALGIAYGHAAGTLAPIRERTLSKNLDVGLAAKGGLFSALTAQRGITGVRNSLEGDLGIFKVYHRGAYDPAQLTADLGERFEVANLSFKPWPCARPTHTYIDLALTLAKEHNIKAPDVEQITGYVGHEPHLEFHPLDEKQNPRTVTDAQFSIPYCVAVALVKGRVVLDDFTDSALKDPQVVSLAHRIVPKLDHSLFQSKASPPAVLEIKTKNGTFSKRTDFAYGHPKNPMNLEALIAKFRDCAAHAKNRLSQDKVDAIIDQVANLEKVPNVTNVVELLG